MENPNTTYASLLRLLSQMVQPNRQNPPAASPQSVPASPPARNQETESIYFAEDETAAAWHREENLQLLAQFCREGYAMAKRHGHYLIGTGPAGTFLAIPGRFLLEEQPAGGLTGFRFWQPLAGGEELYDTLESMSENDAAKVYGYWIARLDPETLKISAF